VFLSFSAYAGAVALYMAHMDGAAFHHLWPSDPGYNSFASLPRGTLRIVTGARYVRGFLDAAARHRWINRMTLAITGAGLLLLALAAVGDTQRLKMLSTAVVGLMPVSVRRGRTGGSAHPVARGAVFRGRLVAGGAGDDRGPIAGAAAAAVGRAGCHARGRGV
jgi:hypothetical protein